MNKAFAYYLRGWTFYLYFRGDYNGEARRMYREAIKAGELSAAPFALARLLLTAVAAPVRRARSL